MRKREIKKSVIHYDSRVGEDERQRSRQKVQIKQEDSQKHNIKHEIIVEESNINLRRARMDAVKKMRQLENEEFDQKQTPFQSINVHFQQDHPIQEAKEVQVKLESRQQTNHANEGKIASNAIAKQLIEQQNQSEEEAENMSRKQVLLKPVFIAKENRSQKLHQNQSQKEEERKKKSLRYTTKLLLKEDLQLQNQSENEEASGSDEENMTDIPDDDDVKNQEYQYEKWKIRELKRIRKDQEERRKHQKEKVELERRRQMNNDQILLENKLLGSDATDQEVETKYVFLQKYYHRGAFYQDSEDPVFKRDYNLPTPMEMQDKSMLPKILQKRSGNFGKKGQSKYTHLTAEDTSNLNPLTRPDESLLDYWKKKTAGYKGAGSNV